MSIAQVFMSTNCIKVGKSIFDIGMKEINSAIRSLDADRTNNAEAIQRAATMLSGLGEARANLLAVRAQAFLKQAMFDEAIADASKAIDTCLTSGQFYLLTSDLYSILRMESPSLPLTYPRMVYVQLLHWIGRRSTIDEKQQDVCWWQKWFVSIMPPKITARIFAWWRAAALDCPSLWEVDRRTGFTFEIIPMICNHREKLDMIGFSEWKRQVLMSLASRNVLQSVTEMSLSTSAPSTIQLDLMSVLKKPLTELKLDITYYVDQEEKLSIGASNECFNDNVIGEFLYQLIPQCRQLRFLDLTHCPPNFFELAADHCLQLEEIAIIDTYEYTEDVWRKEHKKHRQSTTGLERPQYESHGEGFSELRDLIPLWIRSKNTLQEVVQRLYESDIQAMAQEDWDSLLSHYYPHAKQSAD
ncbi:hypothetical protein BJV82DRAFT_662543 [Fennellomyces sp. T-0311]|nr:hypothetical protein BJV82DRAFT_662543 [Fennellomyces sp. T-0311]